MAEQIRYNRIRFPKGRQKLFLEEIKMRLNCNNRFLAQALGIKIRTLSDWLREKSTINYSSIFNLCRKHKISFPQRAKLLPEFWYVKKASRLGAKIRNRLYGNPGTPEGRKRGGVTTMKQMMANPQLAMRLGFKTKKNIKLPQDKSLLAEFIGIMLGDGSLLGYGVKVTFNRVTDKKYGIFVQGLVRRLFGISSNVIIHKSDKSSDVVVYSKMLADYLVEMGLKRGNKKINNVDIPLWLKHDSKLGLDCIRGLADTDGSFYGYNNIIRGNRYKNFAFCFTNRASRLLASFYNILKKEGFSVSGAKDRVYLYKKKDIARYFEVVGSHNHKHLEKYRKFKRTAV